MKFESKVLNFFESAEGTDEYLYGLVQTLNLYEAVPCYFRYHACYESPEAGQAFLRLATTDACAGDEGCVEALHRFLVDPAALSTSLQPRGPTAE